MFLRNFLVLAVLLLTFVNSAPVDIFIKQIKASGKTYLKYKLTAQCEYKDAEPNTPAGGVTFQIQLNTPSTKFSSKHVNVLSDNGTHYTVTNKALIKKNKFSVTFTLLYEYESDAEKCFPDGICTSLEPTTTSSTTSTTTTPAPTPDPSFGTEEYVENNGMEDDFTDNWSCVGGCTLETSTDSYTGALSAKLSNRDQQWKGLSQNVNIIAGRTYIASGFVKLLNTVGGDMYHTMQLTLQCTDELGQQKYVRFGSNDMVQPGIWTEIGGIVEIPSSYTPTRLYIQCSGATAEYLADDISLREFLEDPDWREKANNRIDGLRKSDIRITVTNQNAMGLPDNLTLEVKQVSHKFAFGSVVGAEEIVSTDPSYVKYQEWFYDNFEWGLTGNALKWKPMERNQGVIDYTTPTLAINAMRSRGIKVRGHCVFWSIDKHVPDWVEPLNETETGTAIETRINGVITNTSGLLEHWDVNNENLHGDFFERNTGDANITMDMFRQINMIDPDAKLFLNDYGIVEDAYGQKAWAMKSQAELFREAGVPIYGVGIQSHISADFHITVVKARLDKVAEAGLPMWITELSLIEANVTKKAKALEDLMTMYFSHPSVEGIILWGFWDGRIWKENATLVEGNDLTPNEAGEAYQRLFKRTWRTNEVHNVTDSQPISVRGFKGDYEVYVKQDGVQVAMESFSLDDDSVVLQINL